jgi:sigma-B regulation protein RsbU (phosphoserine phosphatase)
MTPGAAPLVLLVDDTPSVLHLYAAMLQKGGYRVITSESAAEASAVLETEHPAVMVLDYMMPVTDGPTFLRGIRSDPRFQDLGVILLTASDQDAHIEAAFAAGGNDYLIKPVDRRILLARVGAMVDARRDRLAATRAAELARERDQLLGELQEAKALQRSQLPHLPLQWDGWGVSAALLPCNHGGGDLYDVISVQHERRRIIVVIDVSGHGLAAAMVGSGIRSCLRLLGGRHPREIAVELNRQLCQQDDLYACVAIVCVDENEVTLVNAGLPPIAVIDGGAITQLIAGGGTPPGMMPDADYDFVRIDRRPGVRLAVLSDGLTEPFGSPEDTPAAIERLGILQAGLPSPDALARSVQQLFRDKAQPDDATVLMLGDIGAGKNGVTKEATNANR